MEKLLEKQIQTFKLTEEQELLKQSVNKPVLKGFKLLLVG